MKSDDIAAIAALIVAGESNKEITTNTGIQLAFHTTLREQNVKLSWIPRRTVLADILPTIRRFCSFTCLGS